MKELTTDKIVELLREHPLTKEILGEAEKKETLRKAMLQASEERKQLLQKKDIKLLALQKPVNDKKAIFIQKQNELKDAHMQFSRADADYWSEAHRFDVEIASRENFLKQNQPELIEKINLLRAKWEQVRQSNAAVKEVLSEMKKIDEEIKTLEHQIVNPLCEGEN
mgnify:CR=1 FL=1